MTFPHDGRRRSRMLGLCLWTGLCAQDPGSQPPVEPGPQVPGAPPAAEPKASPGTVSTLPDLGAPDPVPDGAPPHLTQIERNKLRQHAYWLADDARRGRMTGSAAQLETAKYVAAQFQKLGLRPLGDKKGFLQFYPLEKLVLDVAATHLSFGSDKVGDGYGVLPGEGGDKVTVAGKIVLWTPADGAVGLKGRIPVVCVDKAPRGAGGSVVADFTAMKRCEDIAKKLAAAGAAAGVICLLDDQSPFANALNYHALLPDHPAPSFEGRGRAQRARIPLLFLSRRHTDRLLAAMGAAVGEDGKVVPPKGEPKLQGRLQIAVKTEPKGSACNVVAILDGTSKKQEAVVFSAHHDHVGTRIDGDPFNGADDNASGTSGLLVLAEAFAKGGPRPARSIVFLSVSGEELGLWGSKWYAEHPTFPAQQIVADVNIDMIGRAEADGQKTRIQVTPSHGHEKYSTLVREAARLAAKMDVTLTSGDQFYERSDHFNFAQKGIPVVFFCDGEHPDYHQVTDHADRLDYPRMEKVARLAFWTGWLAAEAKDRPKELGRQQAW